jgi:hypothetical protein
MGRLRFQSASSHILVAFFAIVATYLWLRAPHWLLVPLGIGVGCGAVWLVLQFVSVTLWGLECPACGARGMRRFAVTSFGYRYFRCGECGQKCKRGILGAWADASGRADQAVYKPRGKMDPWGDGPVVEDGSLGAGTQGVLLQNKRNRQVAHDDDT